MSQPVKEKSLDQMLDELEALRVQKAQMEKKEQELLKAIQQKAAKQAERMKQLGTTSPAESKGPVRIRLIKIEGNERTTDGKIMKMVNFLPGQVLEYPELEKARMRLEKAGFQRAAVEVIPNEGDSNYIDILIKVVEKER
jgi:outer membrane protein assembly factor BamA